MACGSAWAGPRARGTYAERDARAEHLSIRKERSAAWYDRQIVRLRDKRDEVVTSRLDDLLGDLQGAPEKNSGPKPAGRR